jgi:hypothetical protein
MTGLATLMFWPMLGMAALTATAWVVMGRRRIAALRAHEMQLGDFSGAAGVAMTPGVSVSTRHFANHFEIPLLFHVICLLHLVFDAGGWLAALLAWFFVAMRALHMHEHLGRNHVRVRFRLYVYGTYLMWALWLHLAAVLLLRG